ncbi:MAG: hypothetical protein FWB91_12585 [Defluviitaleaceae bacterium]|nr:hypothetical protein [Defluviitaleaceae bacterium]
MDVANINGSVVSQSAYQQARASVANMQSGNLNANGVLSAIQQFTSGVNLSTSMAPFTGGGMNLGIHPEMLRRAGSDPEEMVRLKALVIDHVEAMRGSIQSFASQGIEVIAQGARIHEDGTSSGWLITRTPDLREQRRERRAEFELPEDDRPSWAELMRQRLEAIIQDEENQPRNLEDENATRSWIV